MGINQGLSASVRKMDPALKRKLIDELRNGPKARTPEEAAREAAANVRREMLQRGLTDAVTRGNHARAEKCRKAIANLKEPEHGLAVRDDGDKISLDEDLGERISKVRKRLSKGTPEQEKAVADAIFERIDRKAAEPQRSPESGKGVNRSKQLFRDDPVLTSEERLLIDSPYEILLVYTPEGRLKKAVMGARQSVSIPPDLPEGSVLSHNHPGGTGASASDLKYILSNPGNTLRIVAGGDEGAELYWMRSIKPVSDDDLAMIVSEYEELAKDGGDTKSARLDALSLILDQYGDILTAQMAVLR